MDCASIRVKYWTSIAPLMTCSSVLRFGERIRDYGSHCVFFSSTPHRGEGVLPEHKLRLPQRSVPIRDVPSTEGHRRGQGFRFVRLDCGGHRHAEPLHHRPEGAQGIPQRHRCPQGRLGQVILRIPGGKRHHHRRPDGVPRYAQGGPVPAEVSERRGSGPPAGRGIQARHQRGTARRRDDGTALRHRAAGRRVGIAERRRREHRGVLCPLPGQRLQGADRAPVPQGVAGTARSI